MQPHKHAGFYVERTAIKLPFENLGIGIMTPASALEKVLALALQRFDFACKFLLEKVGHSCSSWYLKSFATSALLQILIFLGFPIHPPDGSICALEERLLTFLGAPVH